MVFNATFNNIVEVSFIGGGVPGENHCPVAKHRQTLSHNVESSTPCLSGIQTHNVSGDKH